MEHCTRPKIQALLRWAPLLVAALLLYAGLVRYVGPGVVDDTFISLRYAKNFLQQEGITWNPGGDRVEGYTSLAWVLMVAAASLGEVDRLPRAAVALSLFWGGAVIVAGWLAALWCFRVRPGLAILLPLHLGASPYLARHAASGMETTFATFCLLLFGALVVAVVRRPALPRVALLGVGAAALSLVRPDAVLFAVPASVVALLLATRREGRNARLRPLILFAIVAGGAVAAYMAWKLAYYGHVVPAPALFKAGLREVVRFPAFVVGHWTTFAAAVALPAGLIALAAGVRRSALEPAALALLAGAIVFALYFLTVLPVMSYQFRYLFPVYPIVFLVAVATADRVLPERPDRAAAGFLAMVFIGCNIAGLSEARRHARDQSERYKRYGKLGRELARFPDLGIALTEAGQLAYYSDARVIDLLGLNDRTIASNRHRGAAFAEDFRVYLETEAGLPDLYMVSTPEAAWAGAAAQRELFERHYDIVGLKPVLLAVRRDSPHAASLREVLQRYPLK